MSYNEVRKATRLVMEAMDEGALDPRTVADMALNWLSEAEVEEMARQNDLLFILDDDEDEDEDDDWDEDGYIPHLGQDDGLPF